LNKFKKKENAEVKRLSRRILAQMLIYMTTYTAAGILFYALVYFSYHQFAFQSFDLIYRFALWFEERRLLFVVAFLIIGNGSIFIHFWRKAFLYVGGVLEAIESVYQQDDQLIELPSDLKATEMQMNQIKLDFKNNEQIAKKAEQRKNDLVVYLAHDLKTPLTSVIGYLTLLHDEQEISQNLREKYLGISLAKAERLEDLINEFFEITRFNLSNITLEKRKVNLTRMLEQLIFEFQPMLVAKNLECKLEAELDVYWRCDVDKMQRAFDNLLRNAVNYSFSDQVITIALDKVNDLLLLKFINSGNTIPKDKLERIFEQFYRLDTSRGTNSGGAGLGLAITKEIIELHQGKIQVTSENDQICFWVELPLLQ